MNTQKTEDYVSFETAKLLKEKGFPQDTVSCNTCYKYNGNFCNNARSMSGVDREICYIAPTKYMALKWLRDLPEIAYCIFIFADGEMGELHYVFEIQEINNDLLKCNGSLEIEYNCFDTYEEACEAAIKYCLENLI